MRSWSILPHWQPLGDMVQLMWPPETLGRDALCFLFTFCRPENLRQLLRAHSKIFPWTANVKKRERNYLPKWRRVRVTRGSVYGACPDELESGNKYCKISPIFIIYLSLLAVSHSSPWILFFFHKLERNRSQGKNSLNNICRAVDLIAQTDGNLHSQSLSMDLKSIAERLDHMPINPYFSSCHIIVCTILVRSDLGTGE